MGKTKTKFENNEVCEKSRYEIMVNYFKREYPHPYFYTGGDLEDLFQEIKKEFPDASLHKIPGMGNAICGDRNSRMILGFELLGVSQERAFASSEIMNESFKMEMEANIILHNYQEERNAGRN